MKVKRSLGFDQGRGLDADGLCLDWTKGQGFDGSETITRD